jgi:DNA-binding NarL/FixJ family response regulator
VVRLVLSGLRNKEIADRLAIGEGTVKTHLHHAYEKRGVDSRLERAVSARDKRLFRRPAPCSSLTRAAGGCYKGLVGGP